MLGRTAGVEAISLGCRFIFYQAPLMIQYFSFTTEVALKNCLKFSQDNRDYYETICDLSDDNPEEWFSLVNVILILGAYICGTGNSE